MSNNLIKINNEILDIKTLRQKFYKQGKCIVSDCPYKMNKQNSTVLVTHLINQHKNIYKVEGKLYSDKFES